MESTEATPRAVVYSALLHLGIVAFLALAMLNCTHWEAVADTLRLPESWRPVTCTRMELLKGPIIEATLVGPVGAPPPPTARHARKASPHHEQKVEPKPVPPPPAPVKVLPTPVPQPQLKDQEKIAQIAQQKAEQAQKAQEQEQKQRMAELTKQKEAERILKELAKVQAQSQAQQRQVNLEKQKAEQLADLSKASESQNSQNVPVAKQAMTGQAGASNDAYIAALQNAITQNWLRPDNIPAGVDCPVDIVQIPGGQVISAKVLPSCPFDAAAKHSVENAIYRASPLPYKGFEKQFRREITFNFRVTSSQ
ncbi:MAG: TonB C-terminal domain-containing protein [Rhodanobacteraceae bacterium]|nr:MAG: TonB C-terminal domain-containing protein [Rhodanobacteraceae bacterium]